jgi:hypothetical protein
LFGRTACDTSLNIETATTVMPPGANPSCPNGRAFFSFGGWLQDTTLNCLGTPHLCPNNCALSPNACVRQRQFSDSSIMNLPVNLPQALKTDSGMALYWGNIFRFGPPGHSRISRVLNPSGGTYNYFRFGYGHVSNGNKVRVARARATGATC